MARIVFAADLGGTKLACAVIDENARILAHHTEAVDQSSPKAPIAQIARIAKELRPARAKYSAAAGAVPGLARRDGTVWAPNLSGWGRMPLARLLRAELKVPVIVESDRNAVVMGEAWKGAARGKRDVIVLILGTGIGAGILSDGRLLRGAHELSGCAGWLRVTEEESAEALQCGGLESCGAGPAIARAAKRPTAEEAAQAARAGSQSARRAFARAGHWLGLGVGNLVSLFDPEIVVLTGGLVHAADLFFEQLSSTALATCQPLIAGQVKLRISKLGPKANLYGAAKLALEAAR